MRSAELGSNLLRFVKLNTKFKTFTAVFVFKRKRQRQPPRSTTVGFKVKNQHMTEV